MNTRHDTTRKPQSIMRQEKTAAHHAHLARGHHEHALHHAAEAAKAHVEDYGGKGKPATA
jgi:hypothetical protein